MATSRVDTLPSGMKERTFALVRSDTDEVLMFGRGTDYPCSEYVFPAVEVSGDRFSIHGNHASTFGQMDISSDYFEASFGATEPDAAGKMSRIMSAWAMANFQRPLSGLHHLYYVLGGRARMMYGVPDRIAPKYNGFKTSFHEGILRFATSSPFFFDSFIANASPNDIIPISASGSMMTSEFLLDPNTEVPTPLSFSLWTTNPDGKIEFDVDVKGHNDQWRKVLALRGFYGQLKIDNLPGQAVSRHEPFQVNSENPRTSGADFFHPSTPALRDIMIWPGDKSMRIVAKAVSDHANNLVFSSSWRDCYAGA